MRRAVRSCAVLGACTILAACLVMLWPLRANGVSGTALRPHYSEYLGFNTPISLPLNPTNDELRHAGVRLPRDVVWHRRHIAEALLGSGVVVLIGGWWSMTFLARRGDNESVENQSG